ncbi:MAG: betaine--homocysteine S-methyltransferase [Hyphomicrobiaceae bacterium]
MPSLRDLLAEKGVLLADGATGTNYFDMGLQSGDPPEMWTLDHPDRVAKLHADFVAAGADIILTNTFGCNRHRLKLHKLEDRTAELNRRAAGIAREVADKAGRPVVVAGSVGPTGELFVPLGKLTHEEAVAAFKEQIEGLKEGGADVAWIETMSAPEEMRAAIEAAIACAMPYVYTASFDTAGRTMMGLEPSALGTVAGDMAEPPIAIGANCGVGASDLLVSVLAMTGAAPEAVVVAKANCGIPQVHGDHVHYSGTPELMADYAGLAIDAGVRIIGGCCGTSPVHLAAMRRAIDSHVAGARPDRAVIEERIGPLVAPPRDAAAGEGRRTRRSRS